MRNIFKSGYLLIVASIMALWSLAPSTLAAEFSPAHKVVIQVSSADKTVQRLAIANAVNLQKEYGMDNIAIEVVAYGPGLSILTPKSEQAARVRSLVQQNIRFSACRNTMTNITAKTGKTPQLTQGVKIVPAGVGRIIELQEQGYSYVRP